MLTSDEIKRIASEGETEYVDFKVSVPAKVRELTEFHTATTTSRERS